MSLHPGLACFFCGVDSRVLLYFFVAFVACVVLGSLSFLAWAVSKGDFHNIEQTKLEVFNDPEAGMAGAVASPRLPASGPSPYES